MRTFLMMVSLMATMTLQAQQYEQLWITGSAVPKGTQPLERVSDADFKYAGPLKAGELRIVTTKKVGKKTMFIALFARCQHSKPWHSV